MDRFGKIVVEGKALGLMLKMLNAVRGELVTVLRDADGGPGEEFGENDLVLIHADDQGVTGYGVDVDGEIIEPETIIQRRWDDGFTTVHVH